jgi:ankyrin repeat protein
MRQVSKAIRMGPQGLQETKRDHLLRHRLPQPKLQWLLEKGAEIESRDNDGQTPLSSAAFLGHEATVQLLLKKGADIESKDKYGQTPLSRAAMRGHEAVVQLLLEKGADVESRDNDGQTPLSRAAKNVKLLAKDGVDSPDNNGKIPLSVAAVNTKSYNALQDYQMQLMLLEQQNKKRLMMARQEP